MKFEEFYQRIQESYSHSQEAMLATKIANKEQFNLRFIELIETIEDLINRMMGENMDEIQMAYDTIMQINKIDSVYHACIELRFNEYSNSVRAILCVNDKEEEIANLEDQIGAYIKMQEQLKNVYQTRITHENVMEIRNYITFDLVSSSIVIIFVPDLSLECDEMEKKEVLEEFVEDISKEFPIATITESQYYGGKKFIIEFNGKGKEIGKLLGKSEEKYKDELIVNLSFSNRLKNALLRNKIKTIGDLLDYSESELARKRLFGKVTMSELKAKLEEMGIELDP